MSPTTKLSVNGTIRAKELIVDTGWSDYVFEAGYRLAPLGEIEAHIKTEHRLPSMPSAREVAEHGVSVGEIAAKLLATMEQLTLHQIEQEKQLKLQARQAGEQQRAIEALNGQIRALKAENETLRGQAELSSR